MSPWGRGFDVTPGSGYIFLNIFFRVSTKNMPSSSVLSKNVECVVYSTIASANDCSLDTEEFVEITFRMKIFFELCSAKRADLSNVTEVYEIISQPSRGCVACGIAGMI